MLVLMLVRVGWGQSPCSALRGGSSSPWFLPRKAVKATLVLLPLLGITYMLFFVNPGEDEISRIVFIYFNSFLESFQVRLSGPAAIPGSTPRDVEEHMVWLMSHFTFPPSQKLTFPSLEVASEMLSLGVTPL